MPLTTMGLGGDPRGVIRSVKKFPKWIEAELENRKTKSIPSIFLDPRLDPRLRLYYDSQDNIQLLGRPHALSDTALRTANTKSQPSMPIRVLRQAACTGGSWGFSTVCAASL